MKPRLLIAMIEAGGGHKAPAQAIAAELERRHPGAFDIDVLDFMDAVGDAALDARHKASWRWMLEHPRTTRRLQRLIDERLPVPLTRGAQGLALRGHAGRAAAFVRGGRYRAALCTHFMPLQALAMARAAGRLELPLYGFDSDPFDGHALWAEPRADRLFVASARARDAFVAKGVSAARVEVTGYPLRRAFRAPPPPAAEARAAFGLEPGTFTVVQSAGGEGLGGGLEAQVRAVLGSGLPLQHVVVCGRNEALRRRLGELAARAGGPARLEPLGFVEAMPTLLAAADLVLAKAGAASTLEPLALGRPVFHTSYVAGNEWTNVEFCLEAGVGAWLPEPADLVAALRRLVERPAELAALRERVAALRLPDGAARIAGRLAAALDRSEPAESR